MAAVTASFQLLLCYLLWKTKTLIHSNLKGKEGCFSCDRAVRFSVRISSVICVYTNCTVIAKNCSVHHQGTDRRPDISQVNLIKFRQTAEFYHRRIFGLFGTGSGAVSFLTELLFFALNCDGGCVNVCLR